MGWMKSWPTPSMSEVKFEFKKISMIQRMNVNKKKKFNMKKYWILYWISIITVNVYI